MPELQSAALLCPRCAKRLGTQTPNGVVIGGVLILSARLKCRQCKEQIHMAHVNAAELVSEPSNNVVG